MTMPTTNSAAADCQDGPDGATGAFDVLVVDTDGAVHRERWTAGPDGSLLAQLQTAVGGLVDVVALADHVDLWVNDEGLYLCEPNPVATLLGLALGRNAPVYGPAVFTGGADPDGGTRGLHPHACAQLMTAAQLAGAGPTRLAAVTVDAVLFASRYR